MRYWKPKPIVGTPTVGIGVAAYIPDDGNTDRLRAALRCLVASFQAQTYTRWKMLIVHDGPYPHDHASLKYFDQWDDEPRVIVTETKERKQQFGHPHRQHMIDTLADGGCEWIGLTNQDNYYVPTYLEWMLSVGTAGKHPCDFVYCDMVHSHKLWKPLITQPKRGKLDLGGWLARASLARQTKFDNHSFAGDGDYINRLVEHARKKSNAAVQKVAATLFVHN